MFLSDKLTIDGKRRTRDGYMTVSARVAKADNVQIYGGDELGKPELASVRVYRPADEVFSKATMESFAHRPVTLGHPSQNVSAQTWDGIAKGYSDGDVVRDGDFVRVAMLLADAATIQAIEDGTRQLSMGYDCSLDWTPGVSPSGEAYDAVQRGIRSNHIAVVPNARGGPELRIGDSAPRKEHQPMNDAQIRDMYSRVPTMTIADAAKLPIFDNVRGLGMMEGMPAENYWAMVAGAQHGPAVQTADQARAEARADHAKEQMIADMAGGRSRRFSDVSVDDVGSARARMLADMKNAHAK